jgi:transcriptional regulator with AAA-type ATPase domain
MQAVDGVEDEDGDGLKIAESATSWRTLFMNFAIRPPLRPRGADPCLFENPCQMASSSQEIHLHRGPRALFLLRDFGDGQIFFVKRAQQLLPRRRQLSHRGAQKEILPLPVQLILDLWPDAETLLVDGIDILKVAAAAPVIANDIPDDLEEKCLWMVDLSNPLKRVDRMQQYFLSQVFIGHRAARPNGNDADQTPDLGRIDHFLCDPSPHCAAIPNMIGRSEVMQTLFGRIRAAAQIECAVLVTGETGTGKELVARSIHEMSGRRNGKFVAVDCGAIPEELVESELFGHRRGAFTTAVVDKFGLFEDASGGTLFLDEIGNTSKRFQVKLLRALQERQIRRLGDLVSRKVDIRVIAATNSDITSMVRSGDFREDLFYRLNVFPIQVPPLRRRMDDVPYLVEHLLHGRKKMSRDALIKLQAYPFPGNVRELENLVEQAVYASDEDIIGPEDIALPHDPRCFDDAAAVMAGDFWESIAKPYTERLITRRHVEQVIRRGLAETNGNYKHLVTHLKMPVTDYKRFMDFLRRNKFNVDFRQYRKR